MKRDLSILFSSAGRRVELINCFRNAAERAGIGLQVHACDMDPEHSAACRVADERFAVPPCLDPFYIPHLLEYCRNQHIDLLVPTIDTELLPIASNRHRFSAAGTFVHVSDENVIDVVRDKLTTARVLEAAGVPVPRTACVEDMREKASDWVWPLFIKPAAGSASRGIFIAQDASALGGPYDEPMIAQELLEGPEYTINMYIDRLGNLAGAIPHLRMTTRAGEVEKGRTIRDARLIELAERVAAALPGARGVLCFQAIDDRRRGPLVFEINARFGGGYPLADHAGARFAESLLTLLAHGHEVATSAWRSEVTMLRYDAAVFNG